MTAPSVVGDELAFGYGGVWTATRTASFIASVLYSIYLESTCAVGQRSATIVLSQYNSGFLHGAVYILVQM